MTVNLQMLLFGLIVLAAGVGFLYIVPETVIGAVTQSGIVNATVMNEVRAKVGIVQNVGFALITIGLILLVLSFLRQAF